MGCFRDAVGFLRGFVGGVRGCNLFLALQLVSQPCVFLHHSKDSVGVILVFPLPFLYLSFEYLFLLLHGSVFVEGFVLLLDNSCVAARELVDTEFYVT